LTKSEQHAFQSSSERGVDSENATRPMLRGVTVQAGDKELLAYLPPSQQQILQVTGTYQQIAAALNVPVGTVRSRLNRARSALIELRRHPPRTPLFKAIRNQDSEN